MFTDKIALAICASAKANGIEPPAMLSIIEVETGGKTFEEDGRTPQFLFERHICYREAAAKSSMLLMRFRAAGLAIPHWSRSTQYQDERTSAMRLALIESARAIDEEVADRSASWGLGQTMGFLCTDLGFASAVEMVAHMEGSVSGQLDCMIGELKHSHLIEPLNSHDWVHVARVYNGSGYAANAYDKKLAAAYARWSRKVGSLAGADGVPRPTPPEQKLSTDEVKQIQLRLRDLGYHEVGDSDGIWGSRCTGGISAFQAHEGLPVTGHYDDATRDALNAAEERPVGMARELATAEDIKAAGSDTIAHADSASTWAKIKMGAGATFLGGGTASQMGLLDAAQSNIDKADQAKSLLGQAHDLASPFLANPGVLVVGALLLVGGFAIYHYAEKIKECRVDDHRTGVHAGPTED